ncbi:PCNA-associated factor-like isoform X1 [Salvelinus fontinalis]|uniref:PCNA-associated factor-like isoform X1 n=1 Tax=Salvelinus fontinalis TaxID=8038 RepID=UPI002485B93B|nr:PCNA-associated factor-like isoform X1 [Salvelinus fontinalis]
MFTSEDHFSTALKTRFKFDTNLQIAVAASAPRKSLGASSSANALSSSQAGTPAKSKFAGGNPVCPRPTPTWQKGIGDFFGGPSRKPDKENHLPQSDDEEAGVSGVSKSSRNSRPLPAEDAEGE